MDKIKSLKVKQADGTLGPAIALGANAANVDLVNGSNVEIAIANLQNNEIFVMEKSNLDVYQGRTIEFNLYNQELIDLIAFCKEHQNDRDFNSNGALDSYEPFPVVIGMTTDMGISKKTMLSLYYLEGDNMVNSFGYPRIMYFDTQDIMGSAMHENYTTCRFVEALLMLGVSDSVINNPTAYTTISTFQEEGVVRGYGNLVSLAQANKVYTKTEVNDLISNLSSLNLQVVTTLPTENISSSTIYLIAREDGDAQNIYEEYIYINNTWEMIGTTEVDTSTFDEVYVGSDTPTSESVEIWINPDGTADEGSVDAYTKTETDAKITEATKYVDNIVKVDKNASNTEQQAALKYIVDSILADPNQAPIVSVVGQEDEPNMFFAYTHHNTAGTEFYFQGSLTHAYTSTNPGQGERVVFKKQGMLITVSSGSYTCVQTENQLYSGYYLPTDQTYASFTPTHDNHPANKKYVDGYSYSKAEIDAKFTALASQYIKQVNGTTTALWMGTKAQYDAIATKDATTTYIIQGEE